jgi:hypothetical protein
MIEHRWNCPVVGGASPVVDDPGTDPCRCLRPAWYFPPPFRIPEAVEHRWAVVKVRNGKWSIRRRVPPGYLALLCRAGLHFITRYAEFAMDAWACQCRRDVIPWEAMRR